MTVSLERTSLPIGSIGTRAMGWWAMLFIIVSEFGIFTFLEFSYFYIAIRPHSGPWPPSGTPPVYLALINSFLLVISTVAIWWGERSVRRGFPGRLTLGLLLAFLLGCGFIALEGLDWAHKPFTYATDVYGSLYFVLTGFHLVHALIGVVIFLALFVWSLFGTFNQVRHAGVSTGLLYWYFVDAIWVVVFFTFYALPYLT